MVFRISARFTHGDEGGAEDLTQKVFLQVFAKLNQFNHPYDLNCWVAQIAYNVGLDHVRRQHRENQFMGEYAQLPIGRPPTPEEEFFRAQLAEQWQQVLDNEPDPSTRETVRLFYGENQSARQIAELQRISETAVTTRLSRFRGRLLKQLTAKALKE